MRSSPVGDELESDWRLVVENVTRWLGDLYDKLEEVVEEYTEKVFDDASREVPVDTGNLRSTIETVLEKKAMEVVKGYVGTKKTDYAHYVHEGTFKMDGRPFLTDALKANAEEFVKAIIGAIKKHAQRAHRYK
jgi:HK97 gp10 family phage protein